MPRNPTRTGRSTGRPSGRPIGDDDRRRRLASRHALATPANATDPVAAARSVVALHGTDPASIVLSARARTSGMSPEDVGDGLSRTRTLVAAMGMRRTIWIVPADLVPAVVAGPGRRVAERERARLVKDVEAHGLHRDGSRWFDLARDAVLELLADGSDRSMVEIRDGAAVLHGSIRQGVGKSWEADVPTAPRLLTAMWAAGDILRSTNDGGWWVSRPRWSTTTSWLGESPAALEPSAAWTELVRRWLTSFGPGTEDDVVWWLGATKATVRTAFDALGTVQVRLDGGGTGHVLAGDDDPVPEAQPWAALLPSLDPTTMGWKERDWYLGRHAPELVDRSGNAGPTVWWDGRVVGGWHQDDDGAVDVVLLDDVGADGAASIRAEADSLGEWLGGRRVLPRFPSPLFRRSRGR